MPGFLSWSMIFSEIAGHFSGSSGKNSNNRGKGEAEPRKR
jgi:hypothetical protein